MVTTTTIPLKDHNNNHIKNNHSYIHSLPKKVLPWAIYSIIPLALFRFFFDPFSLSTTPSSSLSISSPQEIKNGSHYNESPSSPKCDYTKGKWVHDEQGPLYDAATCRTIKQGQNCAAHGRPDTDYLRWRWIPAAAAEGCHLPRLDPEAFLRTISNKHLAFVGDSMARNQLESLLCSLSTVSAPSLVYTNGADNKFRRWSFRSHNATVSVHWSPFLVRGTEKSAHGPTHNQLHLDAADENWTRNLREFDYLVLSVGHWFLHPAVYYLNGSVLGCHYCPDTNHTEIGFYGALRHSMRTALDRIGSVGSVKVSVVTFSPAHFEGEWDKAGACPRSRPYEEGEKVLEGSMEEEIRKIEVEEVLGVGERFLGLKPQVLDVTLLSFLRPDGHPGPYMNPFPFSNTNNNNNANVRVQNDCVHWCLPGPIDTWNDILLQLIKKWN